MRIVHDRAEARWLPSRCRFALSRLVAFAVMSRAKPQPAPGLRLVVQRDQNAIEVYAVSVWITLTAIAYVASMLARWMAWPFALGVAVVAAGFVVELPFHACGLLLLPLRRENPQKLQSVAYMIVVVLASSYFAMRSTPVRFVAYFALALFALNALAAMVMFALRGAVRRLEERCGA